MNVNDQWTQVAEKCQRLAQGLVTETQWMPLTPADTIGLQGIRWRSGEGLEFAPHLKTTAYPIHQASAKNQLRAAQNLPDLFARIEYAVEAAKLKNAEDAATMEMTQLVLADVLAEKETP